MPSRNKNKIYKECTEITNTYVYKLYYDIPIYTYIYTISNNNYRIFITNKIQYENV